MAKNHHKYKLTEIDKFHMYTKLDTTKTTPMARARLKTGQIINTKNSSKTPAGKRPCGIPKTTRRKTIENGSKLGKSGGQS